MAEEIVPVVDFSDHGGSGSLNLETLGKEIVQGLYKTTAIYIINHGHPSDEVENVKKAFGEFYSLPLDIKCLYSRKKAEDNFGYNAPEAEAVNPKRPGGYKESYNVSADVDQYKNWPDNEVPAIKTSIDQFVKETSNIIDNVYKALALGLGLKDKTFFNNTHSVYGEKSVATVRYLNYMPIPDGHKLKPGQIRIGEHTDFGTLTFIFQDSVGGLEILDRQGEWVPVDPIKDAILVIGGDMLQRYTSDKIPAVQHRVMVPKDEEKRRQPRNSIIFFTGPNLDIIVSPLNGEKASYDLVDYKTYCDQRFYGMI